MTVFMTKVWGFEEPCGPLQFSTAGWRNRAREALSDGDLVVLVGTTQPPTAEEEQGLLLGLMEPTKELVSSLDFDVRKAPHDFDEDGNYRWPFGLLNRSAWTLEERPPLTKISGRSFAMNSALGIVPLTVEEGEFVMALRRHEAEMLLPVRARARVEGAEAARRRAAPPPTTKRNGVMHMRRAPAYTYCMEMEGAEQQAFKIGWAFDYEARQLQFNQSAMPQIGGLRYRTRLYHLWDTAKDAFAMEQALLREFDAKRHPANREIVVDVPYDELLDAWTSRVAKRN